MRHFFALLLLIVMVVMPVAEDKVLVILSGVDYVTLTDGSRHSTGFYLSELAVPVMGLHDAGYRLVFANPSGQKAAMDAGSDSPKWFDSEAQYHKAKNILKWKGFRQPRTLSSFTEEELESFHGVLVPGGHAPMQDLWQDRDIGNILAHFHRAQKPTALICHGPVALLAAKHNGGWLYRGYELTVFSNEEEKIAEAKLKGRKYPFSAADSLSKAGGTVRHADPWASHVVRDRELITAQNPQSDDVFTAYFLEALTEYRFKKSEVRLWEEIEKEPLSGIVYDASLGNANWSDDGYIILFIGARKHGCRRSEFLARLRTHVDMGRKVLRDFPVRGYIVYATNDLEIAYMSWEGKEACSTAFSSPACRELIDDANSFMDSVLFQEVTVKPAWLPVRGDRHYRELARFFAEAGATLHTGTPEFAATSLDRPGELETGVVYDAMPSAVDWSAGYSSIYIGSRQKSYPRGEFLRRCRTHIEFSRTKLSVCGIRGYVVFLTPDYYVSFANWQSAELLQKGSATEESKAVVADGAGFMDNVLWCDARDIPQDWLRRLDAALMRPGE